MDLEDRDTPQKTLTLHDHRLNNNPSKLPAFRFVDRQRSNTFGAQPLLSPSPDIISESAFPPAPATVNATLQGTATTTTTTSPRRQDHANDPTTASQIVKSPLISTGGSAAPLADSYFNHPSATSPNRPQDNRRGRRAPASHSSNGIETFTGPPPALSTQHAIPAEPAPASRPQNNSTTEWALAQQQLAFESLKSPTIQEATKSAKKFPSSPSTTSTTPRIPPIRSFRSSATRASLEMNGRSLQHYESPDDEGVYDRDRTLRALEGYSDEERRTQRRPYSRERQDRREENGSPEDLFLNLALDDLSRQSNNHEDRDNINVTTHKRRVSRIALPSNRQSLPPLSNPQPSPMPRRSSDLQAISTTYPPNQHQPEREAYQSTSRERSSTVASRPLDVNKSRYTPATARSSPTTPRVFNTRDQPYDAHSSYGGRRQSIPDTGSTQPRTPAYRQSNLSSFSTPKMYNSSPLVARSTEIDEVHDNGRTTEGTESTASTTAPSTVWDELDDLKSRIRKLELTGKLPTTSGAAVAHASGERPPTATTTATTMSISPKRGRGNSISPVDSEVPGSAATEPHPLLHSALARTRDLLNPEIYKALESTTADALALASMTGSTGQPSSMSSVQSVVGPGVGSLADRQLRRKADSMCRSLTELCIALADAVPSQNGMTNSNRPGSRGKELQLQNDEYSPRQLLAAGDILMRTKTSPSRALSRLEQRRSSLLATTSLPSPRFNPNNELMTPFQGTLAGRRTSLMLRSRRAGTEERDDDEEAFRAPSRAITEIGGRTRNSPREYTPQQAIPERAPSTVSSLPVRRQYVSSGLSPSTTVSTIVNNRRFLDRSTPERDTTSVISRLAEDRGRRQPLNQTYEGVGVGRIMSIVNSRTRAQSGSNNNNTDTSTAAQVGGYR